VGRKTLLLDTRRGYDTRVDDTNVDSSSLAAASAALIMADRLFLFIRKLGPTTLITATMLCCQPGPPRQLRYCAESDGQAN
jgi:hypothetical protein